MELSSEVTAGLTLPLCIMGKAHQVATICLCTPRHDKILDDSGTNLG